MFHFLSPKLKLNNKLHNFILHLLQKHFNINYLLVTNKLQNIN